MEQSTRYGQKQKREQPRTIFKCS